ncbi:killer cell lectin-like receptor subfamily G member 1 [Gopherus evgoodei]|uniref:killer cell lectin-like receptor subfamily G member 1 n=1 Tax=Gopherus evgoodei TaxID=1825980 RepID=UPI0011CFB56B|nr:killer cell lectin-like receptor subfamily G member 1 [Gopherus evgoodei]
MAAAQEMAEGVVYADISFPPPAPTAAPQQLPSSSWRQVALGLALLCILLLAALLGLGLHLHQHRRVGSCAPKLRSMEESLEHRLQQQERFLAGRCRFCPAGWLEDAGKRYYFSSAKRDWAKSKEDCCSRGAQLVTIRANATLAFLQRVSKSNMFHIGLKKERARLDWKWVDGSVLNRLFLVTRSTTSYLACGRVSGRGLSDGLCTDACRWICEQSALTLQWGLGSAPPTFLWGNTTYTCIDPQ